MRCILRLGRTILAKASKSTSFLISVQGRQGAGEHAPTDEQMGKSKRQEWKAPMTAKKYCSLTCRCSCSCVARCTNSDSSSSRVRGGEGYYVVILCLPVLNTGIRQGVL